MTTAIGVPRVLRRALAVTGIYDIAVGAIAVAMPSRVLDYLGLSARSEPLLLQGLGLLVGIYGIAFLLASRDPLRHWPVVFAGFLAKGAGAVGAVLAMRHGRLPDRLALLVGAHDLVWLLPFAIILWYAARAFAAGDMPRSPRQLSPRDAMAHSYANSGVSLLELSRRKPCLVVFLRHAGCTFCQEALSDLRAQRSAIEQAGVCLVLVHMGMPDAGEGMLAHAGLPGVQVVSDPLRQLYQSFRLDQGSFFALLGPRVMLRGISATLRGHVYSGLEGDALQMPGVFVVADGTIEDAFRHRSAADRPNYAALAEGARATGSTPLRAQDLSAAR